MVEIGAATLSAIQGEEMRLAGGAGSHSMRRAVDRAERIAHELVARPFADMGAGDVADVVEVEAEHGAEAGMADRVLRALQPLLEQAL